MVDRPAFRSLAGRRLSRATSVAALILLTLFAVVPPRLSWLPAAHAATGPTISMNGGLNPSAVTVVPGIAVTWTSSDGQKHRIRSTSGPVKFDSGGLQSGQAFTFTFSALGTYAYVDDEHKNDPGATGTITVATTVPPGGGGGTGGGGGGGAGGGGAASGTVNASIANRAFSPSSFSVTTGTTIVWTNNDKEAHTVTDRSGAFDSGNIGVGATFRRTFDAVGTFSFVCTIHPSMVGVVAVSAAGTPAPPPPPPPAPPPVPTTPPPPAAGSNTIQIIDYAFRPATITVNANTTLTWSNVGQATHTVTANDGSFSSGNVRAGGGQYTHTFTTAGTFTYICDIHPDMTATVVVNGANGQAPPPPAPTTTVAVPSVPTTGGVKIVDFDYQPVSITVAQGGAVTFVNGGVARHTVTADDGSFDSGLLARAGVYRREFATAGTFTFYCQLHPQMHGTVLVTGANGTPPPAASPPTTKAPTPPTAGDVKMIDFAFSPTSITVKEGATMTFANNGQAPHTITAKDGSFDSGFVQPGKTYVHTFAKAGTFNYICNIHPQMTGTVLVTGASGEAPPPPAPDVPKTSPPPATGDVQMLDFSFSPSQIKVVAGGSITFGNAGQAPHTVTAKDGTFDSGIVNAGQQWTHVFSNAGTFNFICNIHPQMTGTVLVTGVSGEAPPPAAPEVPSVVAPPASGDIRMLDFSFAPQQMKVVVGGTVTFGNAGQAPHTVTARDGSFDSGFVQPGKQWTHTFSATGTFSFVCQLHPQMTGTLLVTGANGEAPPPDNAPAPSAAPTLPPGAGDVRMVDFSFAPQQLTVVAGGKVSFANAGQAPHTVTAKDGSFDSKIVKPGETFDHVFPTAGTFNYYCDLHPQMTGTVLVTGANGEAPPPAAAEKDDGPPALVLAANVKVNPDAYVPSAVTIAIGGTVTWTIESEAPRYITADDESFDSGLLAHGRTFTYTFKVAGTFGYHDRLVNGMAGSVNVIDPAAANTKGAANDGRSAGIAIVDNSFDPSEVTIKAGGTVSWTNTGKAKHTVTARDGSWTSDLLAFGARYQKTFDTPGTFEYYCTLHPGMVAKLIVTDAAGAAPAADASALAADQTAQADAAGGGHGWLNLGTVLVALVAGGVLVSFVVFARTFRPGSGVDGEGLDVEPVPDGEGDDDDRVPVPAGRMRDADDEIATPVGGD